MVKGKNSLKRQLNKLVIEVNDACVAMLLVAAIVLLALLLGR